MSEHRRRAGGLLALAVGVAALACDRGEPEEAALSEAAAVLEDLGSSTHPAWSPDGSSIAFISNREGVRAERPINFEVYRAGADGAGESRLTFNQDFEADADWSPDGSRILFKSYRDGNDEIYVMDADGENQSNLTRSAASDGGGAWSPSGSEILFSSDRDSEDGSRLHLMDPDGSNVRLLPNDPGPGYLGRWSPDGNRIAFNSSRDGNDEVYVMDADGSNVRRLTDNPDADTYPRWSPDGLSVAYTVGSFETDRWSVWLMDADGGNKRLLIDDTDSGNVAWSPDGTRLLFGRYTTRGEGGGEQSRLFIFELNGGAETPLGAAY
ncbi:MAG: hypothetical protein ABFS34_06180 [Gemmatimonadota bacterium]